MVSSRDDVFNDPFFNKKDRMSSRDGAFNDPFFNKHNSRDDAFKDPFFNKNNDDPIKDSGSFFGECKYNPSGICESFHQTASVSSQTVGLYNFWLGYLILVGCCLILSAIYVIFMRSKFSYLTYVIKWHVGIFLVNITVWFWVSCLVFNAICQGSVFCGYYFFAIPITVVCFVLIVLDLFFSPEAKYFKNQKEAEETSMFLERMKAAKPHISVNIACYHYETRTRRNSNGNRTRTVEKITFRDSRAFPIDSFSDETQVPSKIDGSGVTLFHISESIHAGDPYSAQAFNQFKNRFVAANSHRDQAMHTNIELSVPGFMEPRVMTVNGKPPWWANRIWFYILSFFNASIVLRIMLRTSSTSFSILLLKKYFVDPTIHRTYDFDTGLAGPSVINNFIMTPQQGHGQPQQYLPVSYVPPQHFQPYTSAGGAHGGHVPVPPQFDQPGFGTQPHPIQGYHGGGPQQEIQPFIPPVAKADDSPPPYNPNY